MHRRGTNERVAARAEYLDVELLDRGHDPPHHPDRAPPQIPPASVRRVPRGPERGPDESLVRDQVEIPPDNVKPNRLLIGAT